MKRGGTAPRPLWPWDLLCHLAVACMLVLHYWDDLNRTYLLGFVAVIAAVTAVRLIGFGVSHLLARQEGAQSAGEGSGPVVLLSNIIAGCIWGSLPALLMFSKQTILLFQPYLVAGITTVTVASLVGAALRTPVFLAFALPALAIPMATSIWYGLTSQAIMWAILLGAVIMVAYASGRLADNASLYRKVSRGNADLMKKLANARDEALRNQKNMEIANQTIKQEMQERKRAEEKIRASEQEMSAILRDMQDTFFRTDQPHNLLRVSPAVTTLLGFTPQDLLGSALARIFPYRAEYELFIEALEHQEGATENHELRLRNKAGGDVWVSVNSHYYKDGQGIVGGIEGTIRNISDKREAEEALHREKERLQVTLESIADGVITTDIDGTVEYINPIGEEMTGWTTGAAKGQALHKVLQLVEEDYSKPVQLPLETWLRKGERRALSEPALLIHSSQQSESAIELTGAPIRDSRHRVVGAVLVFRDVTKLRHLAQQLSYQATHDALTGLINRLEFEKRVQQAITSAARSEKVHALCYLDMDQFKVVNDTCGHHAGDELLKQVTTMLRAQLRESDTLARLGGDEFGVLFNGCPIEKAAELGEKLRKLVDDYRFIWEGKSFRVGLSIGIVPISGTTTGLTELLSSADSACYVAKERGRNCVHVYQPEDAAIAEHHGQMQWMQRIQRALDHDLFELHMQSIVSVRDPQTDIAHGEVLLRMIDDGKGGTEKLVYPNAFIPAAERYHLMPQIDRWVIRNTFRALAQEQGRRSFNMCAINLSGQSLGDLKILDFIMKEIQDSGISPKGLCFEITESAVIANLDVAQQFITRLKKLGCKFALDDFGSGLSSFAYLKNLPVDFVKVDGALVKDVVANKVNHAMVHAINYVIHVMGIQSIAEYVENDAILESLQTIKVDFAQGFGVARPEFFTRVRKDAADDGAAPGAATRNSG